MSNLLLNLFLGLIWCAATGEFSLLNLSIGFGLGYLILLFMHRHHGATSYVWHVPRALRFAAFFIGQLLLANLRVAYDIVTPRHLMKPGVISIPLDAKTDPEIVLLANLITLTPGSVTLDLSSDRRTLYVHVMYLDGGDVETTRRRIKDSLERRVLEVLR
jgi:multicomponent Na+:H+ antiporter subunit E